MAHGNRVDLLVKAPPDAGCYQLQNGMSVMLYINVSGTAVNPPMNLPQNQNEFPIQPSYLRDLNADDVRVYLRPRHGK